MKKTLLLVLTVVILSIGLIGCSNVDQENIDYANKLTNELAKVPLMKVSDYPDIVKYYKPDLSTDKVIFIWKPFNKELVEYVSMDKVSIVNDTEYYVSAIISQYYVGQDRQRFKQSSGFFNTESITLSIEDYEKAIRQGNFIDGVVYSYEIHADLTNIEDYLIKVEFGVTIPGDYSKYTWSSIANEAGR